MTHTPFVFVDVETTGMSPRTGGRIIEVAALRMENFKIVSQLNSFVYPEAPVPYFISNITGITDDQVASAPLFSEVIDALDETTDNAIFVAHNVNFDYGFIQEEYRKLGRKFSRQRLCTVQLSRAIYPYERGHSLEKIIQRHGYVVDNRHRAYDDAEVLFRLFNDMYNADNMKLLSHINRLIR